MSVCDYCSEQKVIPEYCEEESGGIKSKSASPAETKGIKVVLNCFPIKSLLSAQRATVKAGLINDFSFCSKNCFIEYVKRNLDDDGNFKYKIKDGK